VTKVPKVDVYFLFDVERSMFDVGRSSFFITSFPGITKNFLCFLSAYGVFEQHSIGNYLLPVFLDLI